LSTLPLRRAASMTELIAMVATTPVAAPRAARHATDTMRARYPVSAASNRAQPCGLAGSGGQGSGTLVRKRRTEDAAWRRATCESTPDMSSLRAERAVAAESIHQSWRSAAFLHWSYPSTTVQRLLPEPLEVDTFDGRAWVSLTPFVTTFRAFGALALPGPRAFPETNVRTYVRAPDGTDGVWFFSLDVTNAANVLVGCLGFPYKWSAMEVRTEGGSTRYSARRRRPSGPCASYELRVDPGEPCVQDELDVFLTGRWHTYTKRGPFLARFDIDHGVWPLHRAAVSVEHETFVTAVGLESPGPPALVHHSPGVDVAISFPTMVAVMGGHHPAISSPAVDPRGAAEAH
jgi:uncharacterized protein YqjF (DUF2071 family)